MWFKMLEAALSWGKQKHHCSCLEPVCAIAAAAASFLPRLSWWSSSFLANKWDYFQIFVFFDPVAIPQTLSAKFFAKEMFFAVYFPVIMFVVLVRELLLGHTARASDGTWWTELRGPRGLWHCDSTKINYFVRCYRRTIVANGAVSFPIAPVPNGSISLIFWFQQCLISLFGTDKKWKKAEIDSHTQDTYLGTWNSEQTITKIENQSLFQISQIFNEEPLGKTLVPYGSP